ncbi:cytochrome P450 [Brucella intermedia]|uniref:cytochrome P450 n=1 Tax=Brucella intermedia TaxID=94625 RepID=UPI00124F143E|nr:cytochrome P450 [Brucella intermedia]KAB2722417.1 cytochrome P450 [Brucella intermedia]
MMHRGTSLPPGPSLPGAIQLVRLLRRPYRFFADCRDAYGDTFTIRLPGRPPTVITADPDTVKEQSVAGYDGPDRYLEELRYVVGNDSVVFARGDPHRAIRKMISPPFHGDRIQSYADEMLRIAETRLSTWREGEQRLMLKEFEDITFAFIVRLVLGIKDDDRVQAFATHYLGYLRHMTKPWVFGLSTYLGGARVYDYVRGQPSASPQFLMQLYLRGAAANFQALMTMLNEEVDQCREDVKRGDTQRNDILPSLVTARLHDGSQPSNSYLIGQILTLFIAGFESTGNTLSWALYCLLRHPAALARTQDEIDRVMAAGKIDPTRIKELKYLDACINESMRLYPVAPYLPRYLTNDLRVGSFLLPSGIVLGLSIFLTQRDARSWEQPDDFRPDRFLDGRPPVRQFLPFGLSVWRCPGAPFAELELRVVLTRILSGFRFHLDNATQIEPTQIGVLVGPSHGLPVRIVKVLG